MRGNSRVKLVRAAALECASPCWRCFKLLVKKAEEETIFSSSPCSAKAASSKLIADCRLSVSRLICAMSATVSAILSPEAVFCRANNWAPRCAASPSNSVKRLNTCEASVGVKQAKISKPRRTSLSTAPKATCVVARSASATGTFSSAFSASLASERFSHSGTPSGIRGITKRPSWGWAMGCSN